ncbi:MAG: translocation/assembly module TamB domain-containing protein [Leptolyngbyaceae cyanobacterium]
MSNGPSTEPQSTEKRQRRRIWTTAGLSLGAIATLGIAGGAWWAWVFANERLSPWASDFLTEALDRPVSLGEVERVSLTGIRFGESAIPPTENDPDEVFIEAIDIRFNPLQLITRHIRPEILLVNPIAYIEQDAAGEWIDLEFVDEDEDEDEDEDPFIRISPTLGIEDGEVTARPFTDQTEAIAPLTIDEIEGTIAIIEVDTVDLRDQESEIAAQEIAFDISASFGEAGQLEANGVVQQPDYDDDPPPDVESTLSANAVIQAQQLDLGVLTPVVLASLPQALPLTIDSGILDGNVSLEIAPRTALELNGTAQLTDGTVQLNAVETAFTDIDTQVRLQGNRITFDDSTFNYGALPTTARGFIDTRTGYNLEGEIAPSSLEDIADTFNFRLPVEAEGTFRAEAVELTGALNEPVISGQVIATDTVRLDQVRFANAASRVMFAIGDALTFSNIDLELSDGGRLIGEGGLTFSKPIQVAFDLQGRDVEADAIARLYGLPDDYSIGTLTLDADISGPINDLNGVVTWNAPNGTYPTRGTAEVAANTVRLQNAEIAGGTLSGVGTLRAGQWTADVAAAGLQLGIFSSALRGATGGGDVRLAGRTDNFSLAGITGDGDVTVTLRGGTLNSQLALAGGDWDATVQTRNFPVRQFAPQVPIAGLTANAQFAGNVNDLSLTGIRGDGVATAAIAGGTVNTNFSLANGAWQADGRGDNLQLQQLSADLRGTGQATFQLAGNLDDLTPAGIQGRANVQLSDGLATARALNPALGQSPAPLTASVGWNGQVLQVERLETAGLFASGTVTPLLSGPGAPSISAIDLAILAENYALASLPLPLPPVLALEGAADFQGRLTGTPSNLNLNGDLALANLALNDLKFEPLLTGDVAYSTQTGLTVGVFGETDEISASYQPQPRQFDATIRAGEAIAVAETAGNLLQAQLYNFPISVLNLPPDSSRYGSLRGQIEFASASVNLTNFATVGQFDVQNLGIGFYGVDRLFGGFRYADGVAELDNGQIIMADRNERGEAIASRAYNLDGRYSFNRTPQLVATLATEEGELRDVLEILKIQEIADLRRGFTPNEGFIPRSTEEAEAILATTSVGDPNDTLLNQLRRLSEIAEREILAEFEAEEARTPPLSDLQGRFSGQVNLTATLPEDLQVDFDLAGEDWQWGPDISADQVVAQGTYENGLVTLSPLRLSAEKAGEPAFVSLTGDFSIAPEDTANRQMVLEIANLPINEIEDFANLPFDIEGRLNSTSTLGGRLGDPRLEGELEVIDGTLNGTAIADAEATFSYVNARAALDTSLSLIGSDDPLTVSARVPYRFQFVDVDPVDQTYSLRANVRNEGLALLNIFTQQVAWESGEGRVILDVEGDLQASNPLPRQFQGLVELDNATISARALPVPMTNVTGRIRLVPVDPTALIDQLIVVERLTGQFSEGQLSARGAFPLSQPLELSQPSDTSAAPPEEDSGESLPDDDDTAASPVPPNSAPYEPLSVDLENIALDLQGLYKGEVDGEVQLLGSLLSGPALTGEIDLANGTITLPEGGGNTSTAAAVREPGRNQRQRLFGPLTFDDLRLAINRNINVVQGNILNVNARGGLRLDGTLRTLQPNGVIRLPAGRVGLFAVTLRLAGDRDRAEFRGDFDPLLDVTLQTAIPDIPAETAGIGLTTSPFPQNEISDNTIENIGLTQQGNQLVRIQARYTGRASELVNLTTDSRNLELSSSPSRSDTEIITLLSGNVIGALDALGSDNALTGIGTFVGSALLNSVRDFLGDTVPISEFRIFQVSEGSGGVNDGEDIGGEIGFDVTSNISVSVLKVLTNDTPFQFNTRYRISDQFTLRGTTSYEDFSERTGVLLEYETRF